MAVTINPITSVIYIPKADLTLVQSVPTEIREINVNWFRLILKGLEDNEDGMCLLKTHTHNTEVSLAGLIYARTIKILAPYTVEFEDGQYTVNCVGANHNLSDVKVNNQVSLVVNNAAGLITNSAIEYASFNGGVTVDINNGVSGTVYNIGTPENPVNNISDALLIAGHRGFGTFYICGNLTLSTGDNVDGFEFIGSSPSKTTISIEDSASTIGCGFKECTVSGVLDGNSVLEHCTINDLNYVNGEVRDSRLSGPIALDGNVKSLFLNCGGVNPGVPPIIDMGGAGQSCIFHDYSGGLKFRNMTGDDKIRVQLDGGQVILEDTISAGTVTVVGIGYLIDSTGEPLLSGAWNGTTIVNALVNTSTIADATWEQTQKLKYRIESLRNGHVAFGDTIYWNPGIGDDVNDGSTYALAVKTFARAHDLATTEHGDVITIVGGTHFIVDENIVITKNDVNVRGQGAGTEVKVASGVAINVSGEHCTVEAIKIEGGDTGIIISGKGFKGVDLTVIDSIVNGVEVSASNVDLENIYSSGHGGNGIELKDGSVGCRIQKCGIRDSVNGVNINTGVIGTVLSDATNVSSNSNYGVNINPGAIGTIIYDGSIVHSNTVGDINDNGIGTIIKSSDESITDSVVNGVWSEDLSTYSTGAGRIQQFQTFDGYVRIDTINGVAGTTFPIGTYEMPSNNLSDALTICDNNNISQLRLRSDLAIGAGHDISNKSFETRGIMATDVTFETGCSTSGATFRYLNLQGTLNSSDEVLIENCSICNLANFTGIMQGVSFTQGCEISIGTWAEIYNCRAGGEPGNEPEVSIGGGILNIQQYRGNIKLTDKTGTNRTVVGCLPANVIIDSTCIAGKIQILGIGEIEADNSGAGCQVDVDAIITNEYISNAVWDELLSEHTASNSFGLMISDMVKLLGFKITKSGDVITIYESNGSTIWRTYNTADGGRVQT